MNYLFFSFKNLGFYFKKMRSNELFFLFVGLHRLPNQYICGSSYPSLYNPLVGAA